MRLLVVLAGFLFSIGAHAAPITYTFDGVISNIYGISAGDITSAAIGDSWTATYTIDSEAVGNIFDQYELEPFTFAVGSSGTINMPGYSANFGSRLTLGQNEYDDVDNDFDALLFSSVTSTPVVQLGSLYISQVRLYLKDSDSELFPGFATPELPTELRAADFELLDFRVGLESDLNNGQREAYIVGEVTSITVNGVTTVVPIPAAVWLLGSALLGLRLFKKQERT